MKTFDELTKIAAEKKPTPGFEKTAMEKVATFSKHAAKMMVAQRQENAEYAKLAAEEYPKLEGTDKIAADICIAQGQGYFRGLIDGRVEGMKIAEDQVSVNFFTKFAEIYGEDEAQKFYDTLVKQAMGEVDPNAPAAIAPEQVAAVEEAATEAAAEQLVEEAGGIEAVEGNPEAAQEIQAQASQIGAAVADHVASGGNIDELVAPQEPPTAAAGAVTQ